MLVIFGITGDLAKKMTLPLALPARGARAAELPDRRRRRRRLDDRAPARARRRRDRRHRRARRRRRSSRASPRASPTSAATSPTTATFERVAKALGARQAARLLPGDPAVAVRHRGRRARQGRRAAAERARVVVEKPFGHDLASARELAAELHAVPRRDPALPDRPLPRQDGAAAVPLPALRQHDARAGLEPQPRRERADHDGRVLRRRGPRPLLRPGRRAARRRRQPPAAAARGRRAGAARGRRRGDARRTPSTRSCARPPTPTRRTTCAASTTGYREIDGVAPRSRTETYAALRLEVENWRWAGVPFFIRTGKRMPVTQTEVRLVFRHPPRLGFVAGGHRRAEPDQLVVRLDPRVGIQLILDGLRADHAGPAPISLAADLVEEGGVPPTPYELLIKAALEGDAARFTRQDSVEESWRIVAPLLKKPGPRRDLHARIVGSEGRAGARPRPRALARAVGRGLMALAPSGEQFELRHGDQRADRHRGRRDAAQLQRRRARRARRLRARRALRRRARPGAHSVAQPPARRPLRLGRRDAHCSRSTTPSSATRSTAWSAGETGSCWSGSRRA